MTMVDTSSSSCCNNLRQRCPRPQGLLAQVITKACLLALLFGVLWSITQTHCLPGGLLFGLLILFLCSVCGGNLVGMIKLPTLPPSLLYLALQRLKAVCLRVAVGPCMVEACTVAVVCHFLMGMPWVWAFILGFVLSAVSPAVVVPSMLLLQKDGYGVQKSVPTLLMAAGKVDAVLAITGYTTCLAMAVSKDTAWINKGLLDVTGGMGVGLLLGLFIWFFPSQDQEDLVLKRCMMLLGLAVFSVFGSRAVGFPGAGSVCTLVMAFLAALGWGQDKAPVAAMVGRAWDVFQPLLFGLIGAEITLSTLDLNTVGLGMACLSIGLLVRLLTTFILVHFGGFNLKEKIFISVAWFPKDTVQAALGSSALDMARVEGDEVLVKLGLDVLTVAVLAILITAPVGALGIGLAGPRLLHRHTEDEEGGPTNQKNDMIGQMKDFVIHESKL